MSSGRGMPKCEPMSRPILPLRAPMPMVRQRLSSKPDPMAGNMRSAGKYPSMRRRFRDPSEQDRAVVAQAAQLEAQARQEVKAEKAEEQEKAAESENAPSSIEEKSEAEEGSGEANSAGDNDSSVSSQFARRVTNRFNPSSTTSGNLLNIIS